MTNNSTLIYNFKKSSYLDFILKEPSNQNYDNINLRYGIVYLTNKLGIANFISNNVEKDIQIYNDLKEITSKHKISSKTKSIISKVDLSVFKLSQPPLTVPDNEVNPDSDSSN